VKNGYDFAISSISKYEIYTGATKAQHQFWDSLLKEIITIPFDEASADIAVNINMSLKRKRKLIDIADLFIAATVIAYDLPLATLNRKHFERIEYLNII